MKTVFKIFQELKNEAPIGGDAFVISSLPLIKNHKLGITENGQPLFFIKCKNSSKSRSIDTNLEFISVQYIRRCQLINKRKEIEDGIYTIIALKAHTDHLQDYFLKVVYIFLKNIPHETSLKDLKKEIGKLINLFSKFSKPPVKTIQGLWAELLVIEQSKKPDYLIQSWHSSTSDKYDFNDGIDKVEVKSTARSRRLHSFSLEQLMSNSGSQLMIVSILVVKTGMGSNIFDLMERIEDKVKDKNLIFRINEIVALTIGKDFEKLFDVFFDYQYAADSIQFYNSIDIPTINIKHIHMSIVNIKFDCDITNINTVNKMNIKSKLHNSLF